MENRRDLQPARPLLPADVLASHPAAIELHTPGEAGHLASQSRNSGAPTEIADRVDYGVETVAVAIESSIERRPVERLQDLERPPGPRRLAAPAFGGAEHVADGFRSACRLAERLTSDRGRTLR